MNIVLLHGIFDTARIFKRMIPMLEAEGHRCFAPDMRPADARHGIHDLACFVERYIGEQLAPDESFALIGFSMGGVIARQYMQVLGGAARVTAFFPISCPHAGSWWSYTYFGQGARDMRPASALLANLQATESCLHGMPIHNYWTSLDVVIFPATNCRWARADSEMDARALLHRWMPQHPVVCQDIVRRLAVLADDTRDGARTMPLESVS